VKFVIACSMAFVVLLAGTSPPAAVEGLRTAIMQSMQTLATLLK